jgi:hypothetical protein
MPVALEQALAIAATHLPDLLTVTRELRVDTPHPAVKAALARVRSATMDTAHRQEASHRAAAPVLAHRRTAVVVDVAVAVVHVAVAATGNF